MEKLTIKTDSYIEFKIYKAYFLLIFIVLMNFATSSSAEAARLKDISSIRGVRDNQLIGYGIVVGLKGTGDGGSEFTARSLWRMLDRLGVKLENQAVQSKNAAAVIITASLPSIARAGNTLDITVSALGDASSLEGGTLLQSPLRAANEQIFAVAQGPISLAGSQVTTVGRIPNGAIIERDIGGDLSARKMFRLILHNPDFLTAARVAITINQELGGHFASAKDSSTIDIISPPAFENRGVELIATLESIRVEPDSKAKVVINERTGTVVIGEHVRISRIAIAHGNIAVKVEPSTQSQQQSRRGQVGGGGGQGSQDELQRVAMIENSTSVGELIQALNRLGVSPKDLISLLQSIKAAGALHGELEIL
jgi:flagellar P-ring protein precursor FlgI